MKKTPLKRSLFSLVALCLFSIFFSFYNASSENKAQPLQETYKIELCNDGDTCRAFSPSGEKVRIRLVGLDAPETQKKNKKKSGQPFAIEARDFLNEKVQGKNVQVKSFGTDVYGRMLGEIYLENKNINLELMHAGMAEVYKGRPPKELDIEAYKDAQLNAKSQSKGVWSLENYQSPKDFRKKK